uniref:Uncharacterized protein n=1 Tax=Fagus sylvatica TaxID=28930 RepID=A0A2N9FJZ4_FAGSY
MELGSNRARNFRRRAADDDEDNQTTPMPPPPRLPVPPNLSRKSSSALRTTKTRLKPPPLAPPPLLVPNEPPIPLLVQPNPPPPPPVTKSPPTETVNLTPQPPLPLSPMFNHKPELTPKKLSSSFRRTLEHSVLLVLLPPSLLSFSTMTRMMRRRYGRRSSFGRELQQQQQKFVYPAMPSVSGGPSIGGAIGVSQGLDAMISIPQQAEIAKKALQDNVRRLKESHGRTISSLTKTDENLTASYANITALGKSLSVANEKFIFMQKLRQFVSVICDFLQLARTSTNPMGSVHRTLGILCALTFFIYPVTPKSVTPDPPRTERLRSDNDLGQDITVTCEVPLAQSQSPNRDGNGNDGAGKGKLRLSDYAQLGPEDLKNAKTLSLIQQTLNLIHHQNSNLASLYVVFSAILFALC